MLDWQSVDKIVTWTDQELIYASHETEGVDLQIEQSPSDVSEAT